MNLERFDLDKVFFTADNHFGHENIIKFCNRPFGSVDQMDATMVERWNDTVPLHGTVFHLGDFSLNDFRWVLPKFAVLHGTIYILSNPWHHDKRWLGIAEENLGILYTLNRNDVRLLPPIEVLEVPQLGDGKYPLAITLCHYPMAEWDRAHHGSWHLHGHSHGKYRYNNGEKALDVGVDNWDFAPVQFIDVQYRLRAINWKD